MGGGRSADKDPAGDAEGKGPVSGGIVRRNLFIMLLFLCLASMVQPTWGAEDAVRSGAKKVGGGAREVGKSGAHYGKKAGHAAQGAAKDTGKAAGKAVDDIGRGLRKAFR